MPTAVDLQSMLPRPGSESDVDSCGPCEPQSRGKNVAGWALMLVDIQRPPYGGNQGASPTPPARDETGGC